MNLSTLTTMELIAIIGLVMIVIVGNVVFFFRRQRRTKNLRIKFGGAEYERAVLEGGNRRHAEAGLNKRTERVGNLHVRSLTAGDRERFVDSWRRIQTRFVDSPASAVAEADELLSDVMSTRGYPVSNFEQRAADISVDHPLVLENYRTAHEITLRQNKGQASMEELRQAMIHYRTFFEELIGEAEKTPIMVAS